MAEFVAFTADDVELTADTGFIGFADSVNERYFWLQPGETSRGLSSKKAEIWLERDDQGFGGCGGDWKIVLSRLALTVHPHNSPWLECDKIVVHFHLDDTGYGSLKSLLQVVMADCPGDLLVED